MLTSDCEEIGSLSRDFICFVSTGLVGAMGLTMELIRAGLINLHFLFLSFFFFFRPVSRGHPLSRWLVPSDGREKYQRLKVTVDMLSVKDS
jgi:hypothetical protein